MTHPIAICGSSYSPRPLNVPLHELLGFRADDYVTIATHGVSRAKTWQAADLSFEYAMRDGKLSQADAWIGAQPVKSTLGDKRASARDILAVRVLYADFDDKQGSREQIIAAIEELSSTIGVKPASIVASGGGLHPRWVIAGDGIAAEDAKGVLNRWKITVQRVVAEQGFETDSVFDLPRVLRLPGTVNEKYDGGRPVEILTTEGELEKLSLRDVWSKLDHAGERAGKSPLASDPSVKAPEVMPSAPERPEMVDTLNERAVASALQADLDLLRRLSVEGWDGLPWHNTARDVAYRLAKIAASPSTAFTVDEVRQLFLDAAPRDDDEFDDYKVEQLWESALDQSAGEVYELIGSGDDLFADVMDEMIAATAQANAVDLDLDPEMSDRLSLDSLDPVPPLEKPASASERYKDLPLPLVPGFGGMAALRALPLGDASNQRYRDRLRVLGEDISDFHDVEHVEYLHPHCPLCFPDSWLEQLNRWLVRNPGADPSEIRPPVGRLAPGEGYLSGVDIINMPDSEMLIDGFVPAASIGLIRGRGGTGKTFLALDIAMTILDPEAETWKLASMLPDDEFGAVNVTGGAMFLAGEGFHGMKSRVKAWLRHHGYKSPPEWLEQLTGRADVPNMFAGGADFEKLVEEVSARRPKLIVVDTLQKASAGADQNSASDMAIVHSRLAQLKHASGATIIVIAHSTKDDESTRGSSSIEDDSDFVLHVRSVRDGECEVEVAKMRDSEAPGPMSMYLQPVGNSVVVTPEPGSVAVTEDQARIEVLTALHELHSSTSFDDDVTLAELKQQVRTLKSRELRQALSPVMDDGLVIRTQHQKRNYRLTPKGRAWIESKSARLFAASRGGL